MKFYHIIPVFLLLHSSLLMTMERPTFANEEEHIQYLFAENMRPLEIVKQFGYTQEQVTKALGGSGIARFDTPPSTVPVLSLSRIPSTNSKEILVSPCPLSKAQQLKALIKKGCTDARIAEVLPDVSKQDIANMRLIIQKHTLRRAMDHLDTLSHKQSKPHPRLPDKKNSFLTTRNISLATAVVIWASYAGYQVAKNTPEQEWRSLSFMRKCKKVALGVPGEMARQVGYVAQRLTFASK